MIELSAALKALRNKDVDSSEMKQFGHSFLYVTGSFGQSTAISVPARDHRVSSAAQESSARRTDSPAPT